MALTRTMFAGANSRGVALLLDLVIVLAIILAMNLVLETFLDGVPGWVTLAIPVAYFAGLPLTRWQGTIGKRGSQVRITDLAGNPIGAGRSLLRFAASLLSFAAVGLGYAVCFWNARRRTLHDFIAGTVVVDAKATPAEIAAASPTPLPPAKRVMKTVVFMVFFLLPPWFYWDVMNAGTASRANAANMLEAKRVVAALEDFKQKNGRYPIDLGVLRPRHLEPGPRLEGRAVLYYLSTPTGDGCSLAIVYWLRAGFFPSDDVNEYDCASRQWYVKDLNELKARHEHGFTGKGAP